MINPKFNCDYIKRHLPCHYVTALFGYKIEPNKKCLAYWRGETKPSAFYYADENVIYDYGTNTRLTPIDLYMASKQCNVTSAMRELRPICESLDFSFEHKAIGYDPKKPKERKIYINSEYQISNPIHMDYLRKRKIPLHIANKYCKEVHYSNIKYKGLTFSGIGLKNDSGDYEIRAYIPKAKEPNIKLCTGAKDITFIAGDKESEHLVIVEGMFDLLTVKSLEGWGTFNADFLCLNSVSNAKKAIEKLQDKRWSEIWFLTDLDDAGRECMRRLKNGLKADKHHDVIPNHYVSRCKNFWNANPKADLNEWLIYGVNRGIIKTDPQTELYLWRKIP